MAKNIEVIVWSKQGCSYCDEVKTYLPSFSGYSNTR
ncbi:glutaredoxin [Lysinibacillus sp. RC79]